MIVDTSALVAIVYQEKGYEPIMTALAMDPSALRIPAPVLVELNRVTAFDDNSPHPDAEALVRSLVASGANITPFDEKMASAAARANVKYGTGNGLGGLLNMLDLMVYAAADTMELEILCTGADYPSTDAKIHPASRPE